jgi:4a-hydroxytetrahydrobiopterin dehydratase
MKCPACRGDEQQMAETETEALMAQIPDWRVVDKNGVKRLERTFRFRDFAAALGFTNCVGEIAEAEGHHPIITLSWGRVTVTWYTHDINGLHDNDFIMAAKTDELHTPG